MNVKTITVEELKRVYETMSKEEALEFLQISLGTYYKYLRTHGIVKPRRKLVVKSD